MHIKEIRELIELIEESSVVEEFEMERAGVRIRIRKTLSTSAVPASGELSATPLAPETSVIASPPSPVTKAEPHFVFEAPIVGTFYAASQPDAEPFVKIGDQVKSGSVLCVIEAMKIFNQIESDVDGEIIKILVENGQPIEYGQPLFEIKVKA